MSYRWIAAAFGLAALASTAVAAPAAGSAAAGQDLFSEQCSLCHSVTPTGGGGGGPDLNGVMGRKVASVTGFTYTRALKAKTDTAWTPELLDTFLNDPQTFASGTSMPVNLTEAKDRADVIAYLATVK